MTDSMGLAVTSQAVVKALLDDLYVLKQMKLLGSILGVAEAEYINPVVSPDTISTTISKVLERWKSTENPIIGSLCDKLKDMNCINCAEKIKNHGGEDIAAYDVIEILTNDRYFCGQWKTFVSIIELNPQDFEPPQPTNFGMVMDFMAKWESKGNASLSELCAGLRKLKAKRCADIIEQLVAEREESALPQQVNITRNSSYEYVIHQGETEKSYEVVFGPVLTENVCEVTLEDPYIRTPYQINNFMTFVNLLQRKCPQLRALSLTTKYHENEAARAVQMKLLAELTKKLGSDKKGHKTIILDVKYDPTFHNRVLWIDNLWKVHLDRGIDYFYKGQANIKDGSEEWTNFDKRKCAACKMDFIRR